MKTPSSADGNNYLNSETKWIENQELDQIWIPHENPNSPDFKSRTRRVLALLPPPRAKAKLSDLDWRKASASST
jgi:hypothetical protein